MFLNCWVLLELRILDVEKATYVFHGQSNGYTIFNFNFVSLTGDSIPAVLLIDCRTLKSQIGSNFLEHFYLC
jgi:hypothetical protein